MVIQLKIGDFIFQGTEIPESIPFGGQQMLAVHKCVGGTRIIDSMGRDDVPPSWSGLFQGTNAMARAHYLDSLRIEGKQHLLTWGDMSYTVVIRSFNPEYRREYWIPYNIQCEVVKNNTMVSTVTPPTDITQAIYDDADVALAAAQIAESGAGIRSTSKNLLKATTDQIKVVTNIITDAQAVVKDKIASVTNQLHTLTTLGGVLPSNSVAVNVLKFNQSVMASADHVELSNAQYLLARSHKNLGILGGVNDTIKVVVSGTTLYAVALDHYGDATKWDAIARANDLTDPIIEGVVSLVIPPRQSIQ